MGSSVSALRINNDVKKAKPVLKVIYLNTFKKVNVSI